MSVDMISLMLTGFPNTNMSSIHEAKYPREVGELIERGLIIAFSA